MGKHYSGQKKNSAQRGSYLVEKVAPMLNAHMQRIAQTPAVVQYYARFSAK